MKTIIFDTFKITKMPELSIEEIKCAYIGKPNKCMCGCSGKYTYVEKNRKISENKRGYTISDNEINDKLVQTILNHFLRNEKKNGIEVIMTATNNTSIEYIFTIIIGNTQYTLYTI